MARSLSSTNPLGLYDFWLPVEKPIENRTEIYKVQENKLRIKYSALNWLNLNFSTNNFFTCYMPKGPNPSWNIATDHPVRSQQLWIEIGTEDLRRHWRNDDVWKLPVWILVRVGLMLFCSNRFGRSCTTQPFIFAPNQKFRTIYLYDITSQKKTTRWFIYPLWNTFIKLDLLPKLSGIKRKAILCDLFWMVVFGDLFKGCWWPLIRW